MSLNQKEPTKRRTTQATNLRGSHHTHKTHKIFSFLKASKESLDFYPTGRCVFVPRTQQPATTTFLEPAEPNK